MNKQNRLINRNNFLLVQEYLTYLLQTKIQNQSNGIGFGSIIFFVGLWKFHWKKHIKLKRHFLPIRRIWGWGKKAKKRRWKQRGRLSTT